MKISYLCFLLAGLTGASAAGVILAQTNYQCFSTPGEECPSPCGCPVMGTPDDLCEAVIPVDGASTITWKMCQAFTGLTCTAPDLPCGAGSEHPVWNCHDCIDCAAQFCCQGVTQWNCKQTDKPADSYCKNKWGCTDNR
jgi:hypothetical protein